MTPPRTTRIAISLAPGERDALAQLAHETAEPIATTAGRLLRAGLVDHGAQLDTPPARRAGPPRARTTKHPPGAIAPGEASETLRARYPRELRHLPNNLDAHRLIAEQLTALAAWRHALDHTENPDPRAELAFGHELRTVATWLKDRARHGR
jgi:hypothetical protein